MDEWDDALSPKDLDRGGIHDYVVVYGDRWKTTVRVIAWMGRNFARKWKWEDNIQKYEQGVRARAGSYRSETKLLRLMFRRGKLAKMRLWNPPFYKVRLCYSSLWYMDVRDLFWESFLYVVKIGYDSFVPYLESLRVGHWNCTFSVWDPGPS